MTKVFKTDQRQVYFVYKEGIGQAEITKCTGHMKHGMFMGSQAIDRKVVRGLDLMTMKAILEGCFQSVYEQDVIAEMNNRLLNMGETR